METQQQVVKQKCAICDQDLVLWRWTDFHGIGECECGGAYRFYHYDENNKRVEKPPELQLDEKWIEPFRQYWQETKRSVATGSYEIAPHRADDVKALVAWLEDKGFLPQKESAS